MADSAPQAVSFDDLIALNDEIAAMIRAGVPLETGLEGLSSSASGHLAKISASLAWRLSEGQTLAEAMNSEEDQLPNVYRAVIEAGQRAGRLPQALESLSGFSRRLQDVRLRISFSLIYPCIVLVTAYYLFWIFLGNLLPSIDVMSRAPGEEATGWLAVVRSVHAAVVSLGHVPPGLLVILIVWWMVVSKSASRTRGIAGVALRSIPGLRGTLRFFHLATFSEMAAILFEQNVPSSTVWKLAAETTGDTRLIADAKLLATAASRGEVISEDTLAGTSLPPFMRWMLRSGERQGALASCLRQVCSVYRQRAMYCAKRFTVLLPLVLTLGVGGSVVLMYALALWVPLLDTMQKIGLP